MDRTAFQMKSVTEDRIALSQFVEQEFPGVSFCNRNAFVKFTHSEDLLYYKDVIQWPKKKDEVYFIMYSIFQEA